MYLAFVIGLFTLLMGFHVWAIRTYLTFMAQNPEVEKRLVARAARQCY